MRLVLDWDGTVTEVDTLHLVLERFGDPSVYQSAEGSLGRGSSLHEVIAREFATVRAPLAEVVGWLLSHATIRPGFRELVERYRPLVLSSGFHELIEPILAREGVSVELRANRVEPLVDGWRPRFRDERLCEVCGEACKRRSLPAGDGMLVFAGDGYSDRCASLAADRVFACGALPDYLDEQGVRYEPLVDFVGLAAALEGGGPPRAPRPAR